MARIITGGLLLDGGASGSTDATAAQSDIYTGKTAYIASGKVTGTGYYPAMMQYDGSTGYHGYSSFTATGNKVTVVARFKRASFSGGTTESIARAKAGGSLYSRIYLFLNASDDATADEQDRLVVSCANSAGTTICYLVSTTNVCDGNPHTVLASFDGDAGAATFIIDGQAEDNASAVNRVAPTTGTLATTGCLFSVGSADDNTAVAVFGGEMGFVGYADSYLTNWSDFMQSNGTPKQLDESGWTEWGAQPRFWNPHGDFRDNRGSLGNMTKVGSVVVGDSGA